MTAKQALWASGVLLAAMLAVQLLADLLGWNWLL